MPIFRATALVLFLAASLPAFADQASDLLAKHRTFVGWQFGDGALRTLIIDTKRSTPRDGVLGTDHEVRARVAHRTTQTDNRRHTTSAAGFTGRLFWATNYNGFTHPIVGDAQKYLLAYDLLFNEGTTALPGSFQGTRTIDGAPFDIVRVKADQSAALDLYVDAQSGAYKRAVIDPGGIYEQTIDILDYANALPGKKIISKWKYDDSETTHESTRIAADAQVSDDDLHPPGQLAHWTFANEQRFPIKVTDTRIILDAKVNGVAGRFIMDTGAHAIALTEAFAQRAHVQELGPSSASGIGGSAKTHVGKAATFEIGGNTLSNLTLEWLDGVQQFDTDAPDGLIGFDLFAGAVVTVDTDKQQMAIGDPAYAPADQEGGISVPVDLGREVPVFPMKVNNTIDVNAMLDSGNFFYVLFGSDLVSRHGLRMLVDNSEVGVLQSHPFIGGVGGVTVLNCGHLDSVSIGPVVYQGAPACEASDFGKLQILLGFDFVRQFNYVFDFPRSELTLIPHKS